MAAQAGLCLAWLETPEDTFSRVVAQLFYSNMFVLCSKMLSVTLWCNIYRNVGFESPVKVLKLIYLRPQQKFSLPFGVGGWLRFVTVALPGLFS